MKIEVKPKVVKRFLIIFWSCFFIIFFVLKKLPDIIEQDNNKDSVQSISIENKK